MSTTMVSNHIQTLEDRLGARLLNRTTRKVSPTEIGRAYYERCTQILNDLEEADSMAEALQSSPRGTLRLYTMAQLAPFLGTVVGEFLSLYPQAAVDLTIGERMADLIEEGFDLAIRATPSPDSSLIVRNLTPWRHILCCSPAYRDGHDTLQTPADIAAHNCLRYAFYPFGDEWRFTGPDGRETSVHVKGSLVTNSGETMRIVACMGQGLFLAPSFIVRDDVEAGRLVSVLDDYRPVEFAISAIYPHRHHLSSKVRSFIDLLVERFAEHRSWMNPAT
jgi:DNA-binding transcriptional LysR family regulator